MEIHQAVNEIAECIGARENYQKRLGEIASEVVQTFGAEALRNLADEVKETHGYSVSHSTLRNYRWVWERTKDLELPEDISYRTIQAIAGTQNPERWAKLINQGYSSAEIYMLIKGNGKKKTKHFVCSHCGADNEVEI